MDACDGLANISSPPDSKSKKYDRQLRLWGDHGQSSLESAKICLVNATATGTEILKNLILPGIGSFTIVDDHKVSGADAGSNFFLDGNSIGQSRAQATTDFLLELNEDVCGDYIEDTVENLLEKCATFFNTYQLVIVTNLHERSLLRLAAVLWDSDVPLLVCRSFGLIGYIRLVVKEHTVIESHPDNVHDDLRLDRPFPGLVQYADSLDLSTMNKKEHSQTPWLIILYKFLQLWKQQHDGMAPSNYKEKKEFKDQIRKGILRNADGMQDDEENFNEAIQHVNTALLPSRIPDEVQKILDDDSCVNLHSESKPFWIMARAVKEFVEKEGQGLLPLRGSIPDMTADSDRYIQLQSVYRDQANQDIFAEKSHLLR
jgi:amyloid beta precursor protein binding protein 1